MPTFPFLSDEWIAEARRIRDRYGAGPEMPAAVKLNQVITDVPFREGSVDAHLDTSSGFLTMELGHLPEPDVTVTLDYQTAKAIFVDGTPQAAMQAFMAGKIRVEGDMAKLLISLQQVNPGTFNASEVQRRIQEITE
jgi:hypothetical protein